MLQVARLAPKLLAESSSLVQQFVNGQLQHDGGFADRAGRSDLYYTVFGLESLLALCKEVPVAEASRYLGTFGDGQGLDFVHLACLARCWASITRDIPSAGAILRRLETFRRPDGGYDAGTVYSAFLALGAYQDLRGQMPEPEKLFRSILPLHAADGSYSNRPGASSGLTTTTAAAVMLHRHLGQPLDAVLGRWLLARAHPQGGFRALIDAPIPDLLSTATALHALSALHVPIDSIREDCLDFLDTLWVNHGAFHGSWADDAFDCEYTYYALLALGHLAI
ncbi:MAG TPA: prenyltransferase/squalene oxidase repeat-containing protein [Bryobacteraceae bacterium]|nr:prenyltransferase/squalene oxidase repeat-containing protein [Bryobacteraceae bacterium]